MNHDFIVPIIDTDSITICKQDGSDFSPEEIKQLTQELNSFPYKHINWEFEFYIPTIVTIKSKNYILHDPEKKYLKKDLIIKGSALKASNKEVYLKDFINGVIKIILNKDWTQQQVIDLYNQTARECLNLTDMSRHSFKKTFTKAVQEGEGTMELKTRLAIKYEPGVQQGDKFRLFYLSNSNLCLEKNFKGDYCKKTLLKKLFATVGVFDAILPQNLFINYSLQTNYYPFIGEEKPKRSKKIA